MELLNCKKILYIDDSQDSCDLFQFVLSGEGYTVEIAETVAKATRAIQTGEFALYLIDLFLADGTGFDLMQQIRAFDSSTPIIICSGDSRPATQEAARQAGASAFLLKPIELTTLVQLIATTLKDRVLSNCGR